MNPRCRGLVFYNSLCNDLAHLTHHSRGIPAGRLKRTKRIGRLRVDNKSTSGIAIRWSDSRQVALGGVPVQVSRLSAKDGALGPVRRWLALGFFWRGVDRIASHRGRVANPGHDFRLRIRLYVGKSSFRSTGEWRCHRTMIFLNRILSPRAL